MKQQDASRGTESALVAAPDIALRASASELCVLREGPATGALSRASSRAGAGAGGWKLHGALPRGRSGLSVGLVLARGTRILREGVAPRALGRASSIGREHLLLFYSTYMWDMNTVNAHLCLDHYTSAASMRPRASLVVCIFGSFSKTTLLSTDMSGLQRAISTQQRKRENQRRMLPLQYTSSR
jgi:hypothetical protein